MPGNLTSPLNSFRIYALVGTVGIFACNYVVAYSLRGTGLTKWYKIYGMKHAYIFLMYFLHVLMRLINNLKGVFFYRNCAGDPRWRKDSCAF